MTFDGMERWATGSGGGMWDVGVERTGTVVPRIPSCCVRCEGVACALANVGDFTYCAPCLRGIIERMGR